MRINIGLREIGNFLGSVPGNFQFDRVTGRGPGVSGGNKYRSQYALPIEFVQGYERVLG
jgi:hypothetical protein